MNFVELLRRILWRILGIDYRHILRVVDYVYLKEDQYAQVGYKSYSNNALVFRWSNAPITIGKYCSIGDNVRFIVDQGKHHANAATSYPFQSYPVGEKNGITIGNDVWIGQNVILLPGVHIGNGVTVAAGAVVSENIPDYCVVGGVPAKILKFKCSQKEATAMNNLAWWNLPDANVMAMRDKLKLPITEFLSLLAI